MKIPIFGERQNKKLLEQSILALSAIRKKSEILAICAQPTGYSWLGVNVATKSLFPECTFEIPQYYSHSIFNKKEISLLCGKMNELNFNQIIFSGFSPFYQQICLQLTPTTKQKIIYHGFLAELSENPLQQEVFKTILKLAKDKKISAIGFVKKGFALSVEKLFKLATFEIILPNKILAGNKKLHSESAKIGCLVNTSFRKNIHNQVFAASMVRGAEVHVFKTHELHYLDQGQIVFHGLMKHDAFVELLGSMTINLHSTFSEGMGGQVCAESISMGVPCISAYTSAFFDYDEELKQKLVVPGFDDSWHIYTKMEEVLSERDYLSKRCIEYAAYLNIMAQERLDIFFDA